MMKFKCGIVVLMFISVWGCSNASNNSVILDVSGKHPAGWAVASNGGKHPALYLSGPEKCQECHGSDLKGGTSKVSCFSADRSGITCHAQGPIAHPPGWSAYTAHGAHAKAAAIGANGMAFCKNCHGGDYRGAGVIQKDCLRCHSFKINPAPHPGSPWFGATYTHKNTDTSNAPACATCHTGRLNLSPTGIAALPAIAIIGTTGCFNNTLCHGVMGHSSDPQPWSLPVNHGARAKSDPAAAGNTGFAACQSCHGIDFATVQGTNSCVSVAGCHFVAAPHPSAAHWRPTATIAQPTTHTNTGVNNAPVCATCHNATTSTLSAPYLTRFANSPAGSFKAGTSDCFSATMCHGDVRKTSNCDACHSTANTSPFKSMAGATATSDPKVGAHVKHLGASVQVPAYSANIACSECHTVPGTPAVSGTHRNGTNDIVFGTLSKTGSLVPVYTTVTGVCSNTYCHGNTLEKPVTAVLSPTWNTPFLTGVAASDCTKCHGYPPATTTHTGKTPTMCSGCHAHVNSTGTGFVDVTKHVNGIIDASGASHAFPNPGSLHRTAGATPSSCQGCHNITSTTGVYPVAISTPPNCAGCHYRTLFVGCSDCHGASASNAWPNGTAFPNVAGRHSTHSGITGITCDVCHSGGGSGTTTHGNSNRTLKTANNVVVVFSTAGGSMVATKTYNAVTNKLSVTCTGLCHEQHSGRSW